jgi:uncharacterized protein YjbJ (UPF0337 family)
MKDPAETNDKPEEPKGKLKQKFALLNKDDLLSADGKREELLDRLQAKLGKTKDEVCKIIYDL